MRLLLLILISFYLFLGCRRCEDPNSDATLYVKIFENDHNVFDHRFPQYNLDTFRLLDQDNESLSERFFRRSTDGFFIVMPKDDLQQGAPNKEVCKKYFLYYHKDDTDTMDVCYTAKFDKCGEPSFNYVNVTYNGVLKFEGGGGNYVSAYISKYP